MVIFDNELLCTDMFCSKSPDCTELNVRLSRKEDITPRYSIVVTDKQQIKDKINSFAAIIVPKGRDCDWLFGVQRGRINLVENSGFDRLAIVYLQRDHEYSSIEDVKVEIYSTIKKLTPELLKTNLKSKKKITFLSMSDDLGQCKQIASGESKFSGKYFIEEIKRNNKDLFRRLIFTATPNSIQSECKLVKVKIQRKVRNIVDYSYLASEHHTYMALAAAMVSKIENAFKVLIIGLGGGALTMFLHIFFKQANITSLEIDSEILQIAKKYFGFKENKQLNVIISDGIDYLHTAAARGEQYHAIFFDVDSKDLSLGVSCPPLNFLQPSLLEDVSKCLHSAGVFVLNLACQDKEIRFETVGKTKKIFQHITSFKTEYDLNELFFLL
uniref:PABS domain-containing protein n=1 Tax=Clastoptera arizonana TaxID=38151 RepID=A0A1B6DKG3_9HEMI